MSKRRRDKGGPTAAPATSPSPCREEGRGGRPSRAHPPETGAAPATRAPSPLWGFAGDRGPGGAAKAPEKGRGGGPESPHRSGAAGDAALRPRFWETVPLADMTAPEWEALCDGCGKCCVLKLEDADTGRVHYTNVTCRLFDCGTRSCGQYALRRMFVPGCVVLAPDNIAEAAGWMPASCAYRRLHEGRGLADWHPLISGDPASVARAGQALTGRTVPEYDVAEEDLEDHVIDDAILNDDGDSP